ncbi:MAG: ATPase [Oscillospiraceae bacterium]|nr:ATPase [Oscillospiraceae bacterium]
MSVDELLDMMEEIMEEGTGLPFTGGKRMVDVEKLQEIIDEIRITLPTEIHQSKAIVNDRADIIAGARKEAEGIVRKAEERARVLVSEESVVKAAQQRAGEIVSGAQGQAREMRTSVTDYCENMLRVTNEQLLRSAGEIKTLRENLRAKAKNG